VTAEAPPVLEARQITKRYGHVEALRGADLLVGRGQIVGLVGDNGAGKSTLVKILSGVEAPDSGAILLDGQPITIPGPAAARRLGIETVHQDLALALDLDATANLFLGRERYRRGWLRWLGLLDKGVMRREADAVFERLGVRISDTRAAVAGYSGGQRQGVAVARAATWADRLLFLDEPTAALGVRQTERVLDLIRRVRDSGVAVVLISHTLPDIFAVCDRITVLHRGQRVADVPIASASTESLVAAMTGADELDGVIARGGRDEGALR
jgi:simple sugar transport system ATP-binding protein